MSKPLEPSAILNTALQRALAHRQTGEPVISDQEIIERVEFVCRNPQNRACLLAKSHQPHLDIRKPYTEIGGSDCYSGRTYDQTYIAPLIHEHQQPCNPTTAFLTPALRNQNTTLTADVNLVGKPPVLYQMVLRLLSDVNEQKVDAFILLTETLKWLLIIRDEKRQRLHSLLADLAHPQNLLAPKSKSPTCQISVN